MKALVALKVVLVVPVARPVAPVVLYMPIRCFFFSFFFVGCVLRAFYICLN